MIDGGALGTLMIGLDHVRAAAVRPDPPVGVARRRLAAALRFVADRLERRPRSASTSASHSAA